MTRLLDLLGSLVGLVIFAPFLVVFALLILLEDGWPIFFVQERIGLHGKGFRMYKLRSMRNRKEEGLQITVGGKDPRILRVGWVIRKYKLDEIPQLWNVFKGDMSLVGPRPEVKKYTDLYTEEQAQVLNVRPGITDFASIEFRNENEILENQPNPEWYYINYVMPKKIVLNQRYILNPSLGNYILILWLTFKKVIKP